MWRVKAILFAVTTLAPLSILAQYANSWVNFSESYFKIPVSRDGIYRLRYTDLQAAGFPLNGDPRFIQLFHRGQEESIYIKGQTDAVFNTGDFIEFYGKKNDGTLDSLLYKPSSLRPHPYRNLYSDTSAYFLTYNASLSRGLRMDSVQFVNVNNLPPENFQFTQRVYVFHDQFSAGYTVNSEVQSTTFDRGEGWTGIPLQQGQSMDYVIDSVFNGVPGGGNPKLELLLVGRDAITHSLQVYVGPNSGALRLLSSPNFSNFDTFLVSSDLNWSDVGPDGKVLVRIVAPPTATNRYQASASYLKLTFPQNFDLGGVRVKSMQLAVNPPGESYVVLNNPTPNLNLWDITDPKNIVRIIATPSGGSLTAIVPGTSVSKVLLASNQFNVPDLVPVTFRQIDPTIPNYVIVTNRTLMKPGLGYANPVQAFAGYRASKAGGSYDTLTVSMDQLYNQFNYGEVSPLAVYSFVKFMSQGKMRYLFLIGKGRDIATYSPYQRKPLAANEYLDLVPSAGYPGGDNAYTAGLSGSTFEQSIPTGRLAATTPSQVAAYLNKVIELETEPLQPFTKELLHISGGGGNHPEDAYEIPYFRSIVDGFKQIAEGPYLGGHVVTKSKTSVGLEQINVSTIVNQGVNLVTFFGHSGSDATDIDIGLVDDPLLGYNNKGKYPVFLINGCNAGTVFENGVTFGENWMLAAEKGSRNFIASTSLGFVNYLQQYSDIFYKVGFGDTLFITKGIGDIQKETGTRFLHDLGATIFSIAQVQQMILAGDPALKLFGTTLPDYSVDNSSLSLASLDDKPVTSISDSFAVKIIVKNLGAFHPTPVKLRVVRTFNDNTSQAYDSLYAPVLYTDTVLFKIRKGSTNGFGNNLFTVVIDPQASIKEISKTNNTATLHAFIPTNGTLNLYPLPFSIVNTLAVNLVFQDANLLGEQRNFSVQMDTTNTFNSPFLIQQTVAGRVLAKLSVDLLSKDSVVYYWRTMPVHLSAGDSSNWSASSFIYINNSPEGWAQTKFQQVSTNSLNGLTIDVTQNKLEYLKTVVGVSVKSIGSASSSPYTDASIKVKGVEYNVAVHIPCRNNTINLVAFDKSTAAPYPGLNVYGVDARGCGLEPYVINSFLSAELQTADGYDLLHYVDNIQPSDSVILYSVGNPLYSSWSSTVLAKLSDLGISSTQITSLQDGEPVILFAKKGAAAGSARLYQSSLAPVTAQNVAVVSTITGRYSSGTIRSPLIGPAKKWVKFTVSTTNVEATDVVGYQLIGVSLSGQETVLQTNVSGTLDLSFIDALQYPQLKVELEMQDPIWKDAATSERMAREVERNCSIGQSRSGRNSRPISSTIASRGD